MPLGAFKAALMGTAGVSTGDVVLLSTTTASGASEVDITSGIDSTYGEYIFKFYNLNPATDGTNFSVQFNVAGQSGFNETMTTTVINAYHLEDDSETGLRYLASSDQAEGTSYQGLSDSIGNGADENAAGELHLFNPSSTTYVKHFYTKVNVVNPSSAPAIQTNFVSGYVNVTGAIDEISFKMASGNFDGTIKMWGVK